METMITSSIMNYASNRLIH